MDFACPATITTPTPNSLLTANNTFIGLRPYDLSTTTPPTHSYTIGTTANTAYLFSVLNLVPGTGRYYLPASGYWTAAQNTPINTTGLYTILTQTTVPTQAYKMITPMDSKTITGNVSDQQQTSVSYDLLYSLQYEFCFWLRVYKVLIKDYIKLSSPTGGSSSIDPNVLAEQQRQFVNALNSVNLRLTVLSKIAQSIGETQRNSLSNMNEQVNQFVGTMKKNLSTLRANSNDLTSTDVASRFRTRMVEYSEEKNSYATRMLALYGFANVIAIGLLFYIYRS